MAENETLDINISPRWLRLCRAFRQGETLEKMERRVRRNLYAFVRLSLKNIAGKGVSPEELLHTATVCCGQLPDVLRRCSQHDLARLVADNAEPGITRAELLQRTMNGLWERLADQIAHEVVPCPAWPNFTLLYERLDRLREGVQADLEGIANRLAADAEWKPRVPPRRVAARVEAPLFDGHGTSDVADAPAAHGDENLRAYLAESLLNRRPEQA